MTYVSIRGLAQTVGLEEGCVIRARFKLVCTRERESETEITISFYFLAISTSLVYPKAPYFLL